MHPAPIARTADLDAATATAIVTDARAARPRLLAAWFAVAASPVLLIAALNAGLQLPDHIAVLFFAMAWALIAMMATPAAIVVARARFLALAMARGVERSAARRLWWRHLQALFTPTRDDDVVSAAVAILRRA